MAKMLVVYKRPTNPEAFDRHYFDVHVPLAKKLPGLRRYEVSRGQIHPLSAGDAPHMVAELHFDSMADIRSAFASEVGAACAADRRKFAPDGSFTMLLYDEASV